jgi:hypothetical protein
MRLDISGYPFFAGMLSVSARLSRRSCKSARALVLSEVEAAVDERCRRDNEDMLLPFPNLLAGSNAVGASHLLCFSRL